MKAQKEVTELTEKEKIAKLEKATKSYLAVVNELYSGNNISIMIHGVNVMDLPREWEVISLYSETQHRRFFTATHKDFLGVTLFD